MQVEDDPQYLLMKRLVDRLERLSADSTFAHRASGLRGSLLRMIGSLETGEQVNADELEELVEDGYKILIDAAREMGKSK